MGCFSHSFMLLLDLEKKNFKNASQVIIAIAQNKTNYGVQGQERQKRSEKRFLLDVFDQKVDLDEVT